jgi:hypothetical protein
VAYFFFAAGFFAGAFFFAFAAGFFMAAFFVAGFAAFFAAGFLAAVGIATSLHKLRLWEPLDKVNTFFALGGGPCAFLFSRSSHPLQEKIGAKRKKLTPCSEDSLSWIARARSQLLLDA